MKFAFTTATVLSWIIVVLLIYLPLTERVHYTSELTIIAVGFFFIALIISYNTYLVFKED
jgi:hypothetical protein